MRLKPPPVPNFSGLRTRPRASRREQPRGGPRNFTTFLRGPWATCAITALVALGSFWGVKAYALQAFNVPSASMSPTLVEGDKIVVDKLTLKFRDVKAGDVIVFKAPQKDKWGSENEEYYVKRVIGLPGDVVRCCTKSGRLSVNGQERFESYLPTADANTTFSKVKVPDNYIFVAGDNRKHSSDSRAFGPIREQDIVGLARAVVWPTENAGPVR